MEFRDFWFYLTRMEMPYQLIFLYNLCSLTRKGVIKNMRRNIVDGNSFAFLCDNIDELEHSVQENLPRVSVVMPLKGFGEHNLQNWRTQV